MWCVLTCSINKTSSLLLGTLPQGQITQEWTQAGTWYRFIWQTDRQTDRQTEDTGIKVKSSNVGLLLVKLFLEEALLYLLPLVTPAPWGGGGWCSGYCSNQCVFSSFHSDFSTRKHGKRLNPSFLFNELMSLSQTSPPLGFSAHFFLSYCSIFMYLLPRVLFPLLSPP
jgi:hypothetical protein